MVAEDLNNILQGGQTITLDPPSSFLVTINTERLDVSTDFDLVGIAIHESIHATLFYFLNNGGFTSTNTSYAQLVEDFTKHRAGFGNDHHPYMTALVNDIANASYNWAIKNGYSANNFIEFDTSVNPKSGLHEYLGMLAWSGLTSTKAFNNLYPLGTLKRKNIIDLINSESLPYESTANPKGKICD